MTSSSTDPDACVAQAGELRLPGLSAPGRIRIDTWGVAHIRAESAHDVYLLQGYQAARSRLFQLDLWRRRGLGLVADALGPAYVDRDTAARHFLYRGDMAEEWTAYGDGARDAVTAFVAGINSFIHRATAGDEPMPPEFALLGYSPATWEPDDVVRVRIHGLYDNARSEVARARTLRDHGPAIDDLRRVREPFRPVDVVDDSVLSSVFDDALHLYDLAVAPLDIERSTTTAPADQSVDGSNNWVVSGARTVSGRPILANDPHRAMSMPSLRMLVHLTCPEFDVIGAGEPMLPGVSIGHNGKVAFGLTIFPTDQEDVYLYAIGDDGTYLHDGVPRDIERHTETIPVRGEEPREATLRFTVHGPVTGRSAYDRTAAALRAAWLAPGMAPYLGSLRYQRAADAAELRATLDHWGAPTVNQVFADTASHIGWQACGFVPARSWDGLTPVPGDGRFEWQGFRPLSDFPASADPSTGWLATANQYNLDEESSAPPLSFEWLAPFRHQRITEVLGAASPPFSVSDSVALQNDVVSIPARVTIGVLRGVRDAVGVRMRALEPTASAVSLLDHLCDWNHEATADSVGAGVFEFWFRGALRRRLREEAARDLGLAGDVGALATLDPTRGEELTGDARVDIRLLVGLSDDPDRLVDVLAATLVDTHGALAGSAPAAADGADPVAAWALGERQQTLFRHPAGALAPAQWHRRAVRGGTPDTPNVFARDAQGDQTVGASVRLVIDVGEWDASRAVNAPGQSGVPGDEHYADLIEAWASGDTFPLAYTEEAVAAVTRREIWAVPVQDGPRGADTRFENERTGA